MIKLKNILTELTPITGEGNTPITVNLYSDPANTKKFDTGVITNWKNLKLLGNGRHIDLSIRTNQHGDIILRWFTDRPMELTGVGVQGWSVRNYYNKNLTNKLREKYIKPIYNPNATFAQSSAPTTDTDIENNFA
ncbi:hypothetical protein UFOVP1307_63 [uncultured Caudovirales phage]|uniref:Uncharacterized protein n=1 Tax=uncultured Caudovirales phage TaxID=2100421 RepID=A0A6J5NC21_9CAUD|nr:hypothetical protein UFOVP651_60 [uncultured Caudovirales phage]CAB4170903.1 hypothetical protein UFOVP902_139 [uncultured Caudovirales phage]CAB4198285.1 hypothetical protein UFOVP1307_63 [uncultured Caudovirales phage]